MALKKHPKADLERRRGNFLLVSYVVVIAMILIAFEWKTYDMSLMDLGGVTVEDPSEEMIPITRQEPPPPPPPPPPAPPEELMIVEDDQDVDENLDLFESEADEMLEIDPMDQIEEAADAEIFVIVEDMPRFPGCEKAKNKKACSDRKLYEYLSKNLIYPSRAQDANISGTVHINFVVNENGSISDIKVLRGIGGGCDEAAVHAVKKMPKWKPGRQRGKSVKCRFTLPVNFVLKG